MVDIQGSLLSAGKVLDLAGEVEALSALAELAQEWPKISAALDELQQPKTLEQWVTLVIGGIESAEVGAVFDRAGLGALHAKLQGWLERVPPDARALLLLLVRPLASFDDEAADTLEFPLLHVDTAAAGPGPAEWSFALAGNAALALEADAAWPYAGDAVTDRMLAVRASCSGDAQASARLPLQFGSLSAGAGTEQALALSQYFAAGDRTVPFALAAARSVASLANPLSFESVWRRLASPDGELAGITLDYEGAVHAQVGVSVARAFGSEHFDASAGVTLELAVRRPAQLSLSLLRGRALGDGNAVAFTLSRKSSVAGGISATAGIKVDLSKSAPILHDTLQRGLGQWERGLEAIKPYLTPGTFIRERLSTELTAAAARLIGDPALRSAFEDDARVALGLEASEESALSAWLTALVTAKVDTFAGGFAADASAAANAANVAAEQVLGELPTITLLGTGATDAVRGEIAGLIAQVEARLLEQATAIFDGVKAEAAKQAELGDELARIGEVSDAAVTTLDDLVGPLRKIIADYDRLFRSLAAKVEELARSELAATLDVEDVHEQGRNFEFAGEFTAPTPEAAQLYRSLMVGGYQAVEAQLRGAGGCPGFTLDRARSMIGRFSARELSWGFTLDWAGLSLSSRTRLSSEAQATLAGDGTITLDLRGAAEREVTKGDDRRSFTFVNAARIRQLRAEAEAEPSRLSTQAVSFRMVYQEKELQRGELATFLDDLAANPFNSSAAAGTATLLSPTGRDLAHRRFDRWVVNPGDKAGVPAVLEIRLSFGADKLVARLGQPALPDGELFDQAMRQFARNGAFDEDDWEQFVQIVRKWDRGNREALPASGSAGTRDYRPMAGVEFDKVDKVKSVPGPRGGQILAPKHERVRMTARRAQSFVEFTKALAAIYNLPIDGFDEAVEKEARRLEQVQAAAVASIVSTGAGTADTVFEIGRLARFDAGVSPRTIAFLQLLHAHFAIERPLVAVTLKRLAGETIEDQVSVV
jgi:hypothetical protein